MDWFIEYCESLMFMGFDRLEIVYMLAHDIKPQARYDQHQAMPPEMYTEAFFGHHGSKFVAIDPEDKQAVQLWIIPEHYWTMSEWVRRLLPRHWGTKGISDPHLFDPQFRLLARVSESLQTQQLDDPGDSSGIAF